MSDCPHNNRVGDNYGESCLDCGNKLSGYGYGGWFGVNLIEHVECIHLWLPVGDTEEVCCYCEAWRKVEPVKG